MCQWTFYVILKFGLVQYIPQKLVWVGIEKNFKKLRKTDGTNGVDWCIIQAASYIAMHHNCNATFFLLIFYCSLDH